MSTAATATAISATTTCTSAMRDNGIALAENSNLQYRPKQ